jgi:hypothetical protein
LEGRLPPLGASRALINASRAQAIVSNLQADQVGAGFGVTFARDESGAVVIDYVLSDTETALAIGDVIEAIGGVPVEEALYQVSLRWCDPIPATTSHQDAERLRPLSCSPPPPEK